MTRKSWILGGTAAVLLVALLAWAFAPRPLPVETGQARQARFETSVDEDGRTRLLDRYVVYAPLAGRLARITLREGDAVAAGDPIAQLTPVLSPMLDERSERELRARVAAAEASLMRATTRIDAARIGLQQARNEVQRTEQLAAQGFVAPTKVDNDRLAVQAAQRELESAEQGRHVAVHELEQARAALLTQRQAGAPAGSAFVVRAPTAGRVLKVHHASEGTVALGAPLVELGDVARIEVLAELLTTDALQVAPGSAVRIERWGGPGTLEGRVRRIEPAAFTKVSALGVEEQRVNVLIDITSPRERWQALGDGYRVSVRIVTRQVEPALVVPVSAVFPLPQASAADNGGPPRMAVFVLEGGRARQREVKLGGRNGSDAWIEQGLQVGETVIVYPGTALADGSRVKPRGG
jgi:HlyD family secretion protein